VIPLTSRRVAPQPPHINLNGILAYTNMLGVSEGFRGLRRHLGSKPKMKSSRRMSGLGPAAHPTPPLSHLVRRSLNSRASIIAPKCPLKPLTPFSLSSPLMLSWSSSAHSMYLGWAGWFSRSLVRSDSMNASITHHPPSLMGRFLGIRPLLNGGGGRLLVNLLNRIIGRGLSWGHLSKALIRLL